MIKLEQTSEVSKTSEVLVSVCAVGRQMREVARKANGYDHILITYLLG